MRLLLAGCLAFAIGGLALGDDDKKPESRADRLKAIKTELKDSTSAMLKDYQAATDAKEKQSILAKRMTLNTTAANKALALATEDPKDDVALDAALYTVQLGQGSPASTKAIEILLTNHASSPKLVALVSSFSQQGEAGRKNLRVLYEKSTDKTMKGQALFAIGAGLIDDADYPRTGIPMPADKQAAAFKEAEQLLNQAAKEYGDVKTPSGMIEKAVADKLYFLNNLTIGKTMPDAEIQDLEGKKVKISDMRGKVVVLDIWATWCPPCRAMIPHEREMVKNFKDKPFNLISLSADDKKETLTTFLEKEPMPWTHWWNGSAKGAALEKYKIRFYPTIYLIDVKGVIRSKHLRGAPLEKAAEGLIVEAEKTTN